MSNPNYPHYPQGPHQAHADGFNGSVPLWAPYYGAPFTAAVKRFFQKYVTFSGRASRSEYWWWILVSVVVSFLLSGIDAVMFDGGAQQEFGSPGVSILNGLWGLVIFLPTIALTVRRLHDINKSGWFYLLNFLPIFGWLIMFIFTVLPPNPAGQRFDDPDDRPTPTNNRGPAFG